MLFDAVDCSSCVVHCAQGGVRRAQRVVRQPPADAGAERRDRDEQRQQPVAQHQAQQSSGGGAQRAQENGDVQQQQPNEAQEQ